MTRIDELRNKLDDFHVVYMSKIKLKDMESRLKYLVAWYEEERKTTPKC